MLSPTPRQGADFRILLIEDNPYGAESTKAILAANVACQITTIGTKAAFEAEIRENIPALILSDSCLAEFDGKEALALAAQKYPGTPFVFYTGNDSESFRAEALQGGAADCISKADVLALISVVRRFCREPQPVA